MRFPALAACVALALAGCAAEEVPTTFTCSDGTVVVVPANATATPTAACPPPEPPGVVLAMPDPAAPAVYRPVTFQWSVDAGGYARGHSMLTSVRVATAPVADAQLAGPESYGFEAGKREHQDLPAAPTATYTFTAAGTYYVRAYATILHDGDPSGSDYWSSEQTVIVGDVVPTGVQVVVTHPIGNSAGTITPNPAILNVGDGLVFKNDDLTAHTFTPAGCEHTEPVTVASQASSEPLVFKAPGSCTFKTDDVQPQTLTVNVAAP